MPNGAIVRGARDVVYFGGDGLTHPLLVFGIWIASALALLVAIDALHLIERRATPGGPHAEIYATPALAHVARRKRRRRDERRETDDAIGPAPA
jgi:hypothetical protein